MPVSSLLASQRPALRRLAYALAGLFGVAAAIIGGSWFLLGKGAVIAGFPNNLAEAVACAAGGLTVLAWAVARLRREARQTAT